MIKAPELHPERIHWHMKAVAFMKVLGSSVSSSGLGCQPNAINVNINLSHSEKQSDYFIKVGFTRLKKKKNGAWTPSETAYADCMHELPSILN